MMGNKFRKLFPLLTNLSLTRLNSFIDTCFHSHVFDIYVAGIFFEKTMTNIPNSKVIEERDKSIKADSVNFTLQQLTELMLLVCD